MKDAPPGTVRSPLGTGFRWTGLYFCEQVAGSTWIRECGTLHLPRGLHQRALTVEGELLPAGNAKASAGQPGLALSLDGSPLGRFSPAIGAFSWQLPLPQRASDQPARLDLRLLGVGWKNTFAWLGRILEKTPLGVPFQAYRGQPLNRRLRIRRILADDETILDFSASASAFDIGFITRHANIGLNLVGWFRAELGVGESVRCAARATAAARLPHALVPLKLHCIAAQGDRSFDDRLQEDNPYPVNVFHVDAPQTQDIDHHHGKAFLQGRHNIGYWAWELPEFPDSWVRHCSYLDEIWTPSRFTRDAVAAKAPVPVLVMPHAIDFAVPAVTDPRGELGLPQDRFLFLFIFDFNSYVGRKNPQAVLRAFHAAFGVHGRRDAGLVIKVNGMAGNEKHLAALRADVAGIEGCTLIDRTLPRDRVALLQSACDCFVSLHRSEGFGLGVAESMFLGKPVISTDWSATAEFVSEENGCPVRCSLVELAENHGPYTKGQRWADPDIEHAAWHMRRLVDDRALGTRLGAAAAATIRREFSPARIGALYANRLRAMALW